MFPMLLAIGPGIKIPAGLAALFGLGSIWRGIQSTWERKRITEPGALLGTGEPLGGSVPSTMDELIAEGGRYDPRGRVAPLQWEETERVRDVHRGYLDQIVEIMEGSRLGGLAEDVGGMRTSFQDFLSGKGGGDDPFSRRVQRYDTAAEDIGGRMRGLSEEVSGRFRETIEDPTIITDAEMNAIIGRTMASNREIAESRGRGMEGEAARRGLGPGQVAALTEEIAGGQRRADLEQAARVAEINAAGRAQLKQQATEALGTIGGELGTREAAVFGGLGGMADRYVLEGLPALLGLEGEFGGAYENRLSGALAQRASIEQPENFAMIGDLMAETGRFNALLRSGAEGDLSGLFGNLSSGALQFLSSQLQTQAMQDYAASMGPSMGEQIGSTALTGGLNIAGEALGGLFS